jgi:hypothetical protein
MHSQHFWTGDEATGNPEKSKESSSHQRSVSTLRTFTMSATNEKKAVTFFNFSSTKLLHYVAGTNLLTDNAHKRSVILIETSEDDRTVNATRVNATGEEGCFGIWTANGPDFYKDILSKSCTFVVTDTFIETEAFREPLQEFFRNGGFVVVVCEEGLYSIGEILSGMFGCQWKLARVKNMDCVPTAAAYNELGELPAKVYFGKGHSMHVAKGEAMYVERAYGKKEYISNFFGLEMKGWDEEKEEFTQEWLDGIRKHDPEYMEDVDEALEKWEKYKDDPPMDGFIAVHHNVGRLVWMGDRAQESTTIRPILAKLLLPQWYDSC